MKLVYIAPISLLNDWAHTVQIMKMCEAFSKNGIEVELVVPNRKVYHNMDLDKTDPFEYNHIEKIFKITKLPFIDLFYGNPSGILYLIRIFTFLLSARIYLTFKDYDVLYTRDYRSKIFFKDIYLEQHSFPKASSFLNRFVYKKVAGLIVLTSFIKEKILNLGINQNKILVAPDAVRLKDFMENISINDARSKLGLSINDNIFGYIGTLKTMGIEKGVSEAISSLDFLPENYKLYVVGGSTEDVIFYKNYATTKGLDRRVIFTGQVLHKTIPEHISACNVVIAPFPENEHYSYFMSPLKIFEYMASKRPMVVTDLPSLREVLVDEKTALFVPPSNPMALAGAVERLVGDIELSRTISENAHREVTEKYTWEKRAGNILNFIINR